MNWALIDQQQYKGLNFCVEALAPASATLLPAPSSRSAGDCHHHHTPFSKISGGATASRDRGLKRREQRAQLGGGVTASSAPIGARRRACAAGDVRRHRSSHASDRRPLPGGLMEATVGQFGVRTHRADYARDPHEL
jgi:hypothetical protein